MARGLGRSEFRCKSNLSKGVRAKGDSHEVLASPFQRANSNCLRRELFDVPLGSRSFTPADGIPSWEWIGKPTELTLDSNQCLK